MLVTRKHLHKLRFPLYVLPSDNWHITDGVLFLDEKVIDEKNMPGKSLGVRRIQCGRKDLLPLKKAIFTIPDLIQCKTKVFVDRCGKPFIYEKTYRSRLKCYKIKRVDRKDSASLLWVHGVSAPFTIERPPLTESKYVRILHYEKEPWLIYDYVRDPVKDTYRRV